jgi:hypothetical protein
MAIDASRRLLLREPFLTQQLRWIMTSQLSFLVLVHVETNSLKVTAVSSFAWGVLWTSWGQTSHLICSIRPTLYRTYKLSLKHWNIFFQHSFMPVKIMLRLTCCKTDASMVQTWNPGITTINQRQRFHKVSYGFQASPRLVNLIWHNFFPVRERGLRGIGNWYSTRSRYFVFLQNSKFMFGMTRAHISAEA